MTNQTNQRTWLDPKGLQEEYGFSTSRQATLRSERKIPYYSVGRYIRYYRAEIDDWIMTHKVV